MPINNKQQEFILEYCSNGHNATKAYKTAYPDCNSGHRQAGARLLTYVDIEAKINEHMANMGKEQGYSVEQCQQEYEEARQRAITCKQVSAEIQAVTGKARLYGMDKDVHVAQDTPNTLSGQDLEHAQAVAKAALELKHGGPRLAKETA